MNEVMISVIIPTHNRAYIISNAIKSVLEQTYKNLELIVVDDGSNDDTKNIVNKFNDTRLKYIKYDKARGACYARNLGIKSAKGSYIAFNDSDDMWHFDKLEKQLRYIKKTSADVVFCALSRHNLDENGKEDTVPAINEGQVFYKDFLNQSLASTQAIFGRAECFKRIMFDVEMPRFQDWELMLRIVQKYKVFFQKEALVDVWIQSDSITNSNLRTVDGLQKLIRKNYNGLMLYAKDNCINLYIWLIREMRMAGQNPKKEYLWLLKQKFSLEICIKTIMAYCNIY